MASRVKKNKMEIVRERNQKFREMLLKEPKVSVLGSEIFKQYCGDRLTFTYNDFPVSIKFDGTYQKYPRTIATLLEKKLENIAKSNAPKKVNTRIN